jgi:type II secretory ATPase GspE/PulE/Tfp pilus assembly ATPase PilB-like protein
MLISTGHPADPSDAWRDEPLGQILKRLGVVIEGQIQQALEHQKKNGGLIGEILVELGFVSREEVLLALSVQMGATRIDPKEIGRPEIQSGLDVPRVDETLANSRPVVMLVNLVLNTAVKAGATEIRFDDEDGKFIIRYRVEGILYEMETPPLHLHSLIIARLMGESGMDRSRRARPQEGRATLGCAGRKYLVDASYQPSRQGGSMVWRLSEEPTAER